MARAVARRRPAPRGLGRAARAARAGKRGHGRKDRSGARLVRADSGVPARRPDRHGERPCPGRPRRSKLRNHPGGSAALLAPAEIDRALRMKIVERAYAEDRKSTRLNSSHLVISYAVFCLKKKN